MASVISSDPALQLVAGVASGLFLASLLCLLACMVLRCLRLRSERRHADLEHTWRSVCFAAMVGDLPATLPELARRDIRQFVEIWLDTLDRVRGSDAVTGLLHLARRLQLSWHMLPLMRSLRTDDKLLALLCLGALQDSRVLPLARRSLDVDYPLLSLAAARALMEVDPHNSVPLLLARLDRPGWPLGRIGQLLRLAPPSVLQQHLKTSLASAPVTLLARLLAVMHELAESDFERAARTALMRFPEHPDILQQVLRLSRDPACLALARGAMEHARADVRQAAITALGRVGGELDTFLLRGRLEHDSWANQQAAARALIHLPGMTRTRAVSLLQELRATSGRLHWQQALYDQHWLPEHMTLELPAHA